MAKKKEQQFNSPAWNRFMNEFFDRSDYMQWHDGIDPNVVLQLNQEEKTVAEYMLIELMQKDGQWPTRGLGMMKSKKAIPALKEKLENSNGIIRLRVAFALEQIEEDGKYIKYIIHELKENPSPYDRFEAAMNLREFPTEEAIEALFDGMTDKDYLVRYHSSDSILYIYGFNPDVFEQKEIFNEIRSKKEGKKTRKEDYLKAVKLMTDLVQNKKRKIYPEQ